MPMVTSTRMPNTDSVQQQMPPDISHTRASATAHAQQALCVVHASPAPARNSPTAGLADETASPAPARRALLPVSRTITQVPPPRWQQRQRRDQPAPAPRTPHGREAPRAGANAPKAAPCARGPDAAAAECAAPFHGLARPLERSPRCTEPPHSARPSKRGSASRSDGWGWRV